jgi:aspartate aminotransferase-like enzyme/GNAT superfamily N-acetyltransferase
MSRYTFKIADRDSEFEAVHALNYRTFVEEIPQHPANADGRLVDPFHAQNTYAICLDGDQLVGMLAGRAERPFSLDRKLPDLQRYLPPHRKPVEIRLLAVDPAHRRTDVFARLAALLAQHFAGLGHDLALISGTLRQRKLYDHLGFTPFGPTTGTPQAPFQPMYLDLRAYARLAPRLARLPAAGQPVNLLPGPVHTADTVERAWREPAISHRSPEFMAMHASTCRALCELTGASRAVLLSGTGTFANDAIAAQISRWPGRGLVLASGEFGERLVDHARRWELEFSVLRQPWGQAWDLQRLADRLAHEKTLRWVWAVACETSTGVLHRTDELARLCAAHGAELCLDAVSAVGSVPIRLDAVRLASCVSGKGLGAYAGLSAVLANGPFVAAGRLPRSLDLAGYEAADGVAFTLSSRLLAALHAALTTTDWPARFARTARSATALRQQLRERGYVLVADDAVATPAVISIALPRQVSAQKLCARLKRAGFLLSHESAYLARRNWIQICLMGEFSEDQLHRLVELLAPAEDSATLRGTHAIS